MNRFIDENKDNWRRLEDLLGMLSGSGLRGLSKMEVREFGELYRRAAADLAIARAETRDPKVINYLNSLVVRAHGRIYRAEGGAVGIFKTYFRRDLPAAFRSILPFSAFAFFLFMFFVVAAFVLAFRDPEFTNLLGLADVETMAASNNRWWLSLNEANQVGSSAILTNNIRVAFFAFGLGAFFGIGTIYVLVYNALLIGGVLGTCYRVDPNFGAGLANFMVAHGVAELLCIFIAAGAGMSIGYAILVPGDLTRAEALKKRGVEAARIVIGIALFLFAAGVIEGFISPSDLPVPAKIATGVLTGTLMLLYLGFVGIKPDARAEAVEK